MSTTYGVSKCQTTRIRTSKTSKVAKVASRAVKADRRVVSRAARVARKAASRTSRIRTKIRTRIARVAKAASRADRVSARRAYPSAIGNEQRREALLCCAPHVIASLHPGLTAVARLAVSGHNV